MLGSFPAPTVASATGVGARPPAAAHQGPHTVGQGACGTVRHLVQRRVALGEQMDFEGAYPPMGRREMLPFVPPNAKTVLDVGCHRGEFAELVRQQREGVEIWAIEPNAAAARIASTRVDHIVVGSFPDALPSTAKKRFDVVLFNDVLEHMTDPWSALRSARGLLADNGVVVASIPNLRYFQVLFPLVFNGTFEYADHGVMDRTHLRFFTRSSIQSMFTAAGYRVMSIDGINTSPSKWARAASLIPFLGKDILALQYAVVAKTAV